jgi:hypothetical protein
MEPNAEILSDVPIRRDEFEWGNRIVVDLGPWVDHASVDILDDVALIVLDHGNDQSQFELELPETGEADTFITNGVLTIEVKGQ